MVGETGGERNVMECEKIVTKKKITTARKVACNSVYTRSTFAIVIYKIIDIDIRLGRFTP